MRIEDDIKLDFDDVLIRPKRSTLSSRNEVDLVREYNFKHNTPTSLTHYSGIPIIAANMDTVGTIDMAKALYKHKLSTALHKHIPVEKIVEYLRETGDQNFWFSMGITNEDMARLAHYHSIARRESLKMNICVDVANGYQKSFVDAVEFIRSEYRLATIMAGNVVTADITEALILAGADIVKVGIGPGSVCTTRTKTGVGYPQLSAIIECADAAHGLGGHVCADGGCRTPSDVVKAFSAGADYVMLGGMLAGHDECRGQITPLPTYVLKDGVKMHDFGDNTGLVEYTDTTDKVFNLPFNVNLKEHLGHAYLMDKEWPTLFEKVIAPNSKMKFYGMSSKEAQDRHSEGLKDYRAAEGKCVEVPYKGPVENTIQEILGGLRSACTYVGAKKLKELSKRTTFVRVNRQKNDIYGSD